MDEGEKKQCSNEGRRDILRKSAYAVYATPLITSMLVEKASAHQSWGSSTGKTTKKGSSSWLSKFFKKIF